MGIVADKQNLGDLFASAHEEALARRIDLEVNKVADMISKSIHELVDRLKQNPTEASKFGEYRFRYNVIYGQTDVVDDENIWKMAVSGLKKQGIDVRVFYETNDDSPNCYVVTLSTKQGTR